MSIDVKPMDLVSFPAVQSEGEVSGEDEPVVVLDHQGVPHPAFGVLFHSTFVEGNFQFMSVSIFGIKEASFWSGNEEIDVENNTNGYLLVHEAAPGVNNTIKVILHLKLYNHPLLSTS